MLVIKLQSGYWNALEKLQQMHSFTKSIVSHMIPWFL